MSETSLTLVTGRTHYPLDAADMKVQLSINAAETGFDDYIETLIKVATEVVEHDTQLKLTRETWRYTMEQFEEDEFYIPLAPIASITSIQYYDSLNTLQTLSSAYYTLDGISGGLPRGNSRVYLNDPYDWPYTFDREDAVQTTFVAGYGTSAPTVPESLKHALKLLVTFFFEHRGEPVADNIRMYPAYDALIARFMRSSYP